MRYEVLILVLLEIRVSKFSDVSKNRSVSIIRFKTYTRVGRHRYVRME